jgi:FMN-dependent NADH-azoreductase
MTLFRLDASIRRDGSHSRALADLVEAEWRSARPDDRVVNREIGVHPISSDAWAGAVSTLGVAAEDLSAAQLDAVELATTLADELSDADAYLFAVPLYNFGVSQHFKTWTDLVITDPRMASAVESPVAGRPAILATVHGGAYGAGTPREGWNHATPWMRRILEDVWRLDLKVVELEFTLVGVNPALDEFKEMAAEMRVAAEDLARSHGRELAASL